LHWLESLRGALSDCIIGGSSRRAQIRE
jgi:hypothetical protein